MVERAGEGKTYHTIQILARGAVWAYFRHVKVICRAPIPTDGPLLVAANHTNMVLDPAMLVATFPHARPCHFWALARFFRMPLAGHILTAAGVLPVDTKTHSNAKLFEHTLACLEKQGVVALFPEGTSYTAPKHLPFKDGLSWATYEYLTQQVNNSKTEGPRHIDIIPVGITYTTKNKWRSDVIVEYGEPIRVTTDDLAAFQTDSRAAVKKLTAQITAEVEKGTVNSPDWDTAHAAAQARSIVFGADRAVRLEDYVKVAQSFTEIFHPDRTVDPDNPRTKIKTQLLIFSETLKRLRLTSQDIRMYENREITLTRAVLRLISTSMALAVQIPFFLPGILFNSPIYILGKLANKYEKYTETVSQDKLLISVGLALPMYSTLFYMMWKAMDFTLVGFTVPIFLIPLFVWYHMAFIDKRYDMAKQVIASWRTFVAVAAGAMGVQAANQRRELEEAVSLRRWCQRHVKQLLVDLARQGDPHATYLVDYGKPLFNLTASTS
ncbi:uncharacterized protein BYT42DRAFT_595028 [Radiomyces spectabilis]|uniref:uncharacterized protein n=1 Tax=Radiomyces spectabilis TaxID=64574 RepID=UPI00221F540A|nr:uncharacterized protein BYT42DRAFT_595028 [Radiomyces spectabilis]KAI8371505.1 hypothetical protein BYT42DRAFT_595028 [Radiomyces spectabilis]